MTEKIVNKHDFAIYLWKTHEKNNPKIHKNQNFENFEVVDSFLT